MLLASADAVMRHPRFFARVHALARCVVLCELEGVSLLESLRACAVCAVLSVEIVCFYTVICSFCLQISPNCIVDTGSGRPGLTTRIPAPQIHRTEFCLVSSLPPHVSHLPAM